LIASTNILKKKVVLSPDPFESGREMNENRENYDLNHLLILYKLKEYQFLMNKII
jgi:hypothetical protein